VIDQLYVPNDVAEVIAFAKIRASVALTDNRLIMFILKALKYGTKEQITSSFIQKVFQHMESIKHPFVEDLSRYEVTQIESAAWTILQFQQNLWAYLLARCHLTTNDQAIAQLIVQYMYGDPNNLSKLLHKLTKQRVSNGLLVALVEHQKDFNMSLYYTVAQSGKSDWWIRDQADIMG